LKINFETKFEITFEIHFETNSEINFAIKFETNFKIIIEINFEINVKINAKNFFLKRKPNKKVFMMRNLSFIFIFF
jgi:hypothetical protein